MFLLQIIFSAFLALQSTQVFSATPKCEVSAGKKFCSQVNFVKGISRKRDSKFNISFFDKKGRKLKLDALPQVKLWMKMKGGHEHGSETEKIKKLKQGYLVENVWFLMLGRWELRMEIMLRGQKFTDTVSLCVKKQEKLSHIGECSS